MVIKNFGQELWDAAAQKISLDIEYFVGMETYPDEMTYHLAATLSELLSLSLEQVLEAFGLHWATETAMKEYPELMESAGDTFSEFLVNLPNFHTQIVLMMPNLKPPEFQCTDIQIDSLKLHYFSERNGLAAFVVGILKGLGEIYDTDLNIQHIQKRSPEQDHDVFLLKWNKSNHL